MSIGAFYIRTLKKKKRRRYFFPSTNFLTNFSINFEYTRSSTNKLAMAAVRAKDLIFPPFPTSSPFSMAIYDIHVYHSGIGWGARMGEFCCREVVFFLIKKKHCFGVRGIRWFYFINRRVFLTPFLFFLFASSPPPHHLFKYHKTIRIKPKTMVIPNNQN